MMWMVWWHLIVSKKLLFKNGLFGIKLIVSYLLYVYVLYDGIMLLGHTR